MKRSSLLPHHWTSLRARIDALCVHSQLHNALWLNGRESAESLPYDGVFVFPFLLSSMSDTARNTYLSACIPRASVLIFAEYRLPERNLDFPAYWLTCAVSCLFPFLQSFLRSGGIEGVLQTYSLSASTRHPVLCGAASIIACSID